MSRIGKQPVPVPAGVDIRVDKKIIHVKGPKGTLDVGLEESISAKLSDGQVEVLRDNDENQTRAYHGLGRALLANAVTGVSEGWSKGLEIIGIGYRAEKQGNEVLFNLGFSHPINFKIPEGIDIEVDSKAGKVVVTGIDRQQVGQVAAEIRALRPPEPYKGKGIRYQGEYIRIKAGKQGAAV
ncbi:MAG: 50S ribosomal protein L6 [bacterium]|nr:50S ribosomal protein L6 [bacterium]